MRAAPLEGELITANELELVEEAGAKSSDLLQVFNFKAKAAEFAQAFQNLLSWGDAVEGTELEAEYAALVDRGFSIRDRIDQLMSQVDAALRWIKGIIPGLDGLGCDRRTLGLAWFIPVGAIIALLAIVGFWLSDYAKFARRFAEQQRIAAELRAQGVSPIEANRQAAATVSTAAPGLLSFGGGTVPWLLILAAGAGGLYLYRRKRA